MALVYTQISICNIYPDVSNPCLDESYTLEI